MISTDASLVERIAEALNFGFHATRDSTSASLNGKMSEYHAAVGLAEFDGWPAKRSSLQEVITRYRRALSSKNLLSRFVAWPDISACYALFFCLGNTEADRVQREFQQGDIDFRFWYGTGLHRQTYFSNHPRDSLEITEDIGQRLIGLPMATDLTEEAIMRVTAGLQRAVRGKCRAK